MRLAVIGAGVFGGAFTAAATRAGHDVTVAARRMEHAEKTAAEAGAAAAPVDRAIAGADIVALAIPAEAGPDWAGEYADRLAGKVVVDVTNPVTADFSDLYTSGTSAAELIQDRLGRVPVVKAFNTVLGSRLNAPAEDGTPLDAYLAGDDAAAKTAVAELAGSLGFAARDAGSLRMARSLEEMAFLHISLNAANGWAWRSAWQLVGPTTI